MTPAYTSSLLLLACVTMTTAHRLFAYWIGGWDVHSEGSFVWASDNRPITFSDWAGAQPDNTGNNEDCLEIRVVVGSLWNDRTCSIRNRYICEKVKKSF
ncbi:hypothetical protein BaRGS_00017687, partial [Batillaria attramentaria]